MARDTLIVNEIYHSIQGESSWAGLPCVLIRLTGCPLRCTWCDTEYAFTEGRPMTIADILDKVSAYACDLVEVTGGEPLAQPATSDLLAALCDAGKRVLLETAGSHDISGLDPRVIRIMDLKCPSSGEQERNLWSNVDHLRPQDEVKFVIGDRVDYDWAKATVERHRLAERCTVLVSPVHGRLDPADLAGWVLADRLPVRLQLQLHKLIWPTATRGI
jgi:7-carboxy-7-deazaguanine synthase